MHRLRTLLPILLVVLLGAACIWLVLSTGDVAEPPPITRKVTQETPQSPEAAPPPLSDDWPTRKPVAEVWTEVVYEDAPEPTGVAIRGRVFNRHGAPVPDAKVYMNRHLADTGGPPDAVSGEDGRFVIEDVPENGFRLAAYHDEYPPGYVNVTGVISTEREVRIELEQGGGVEGRVTYGGKGLAGALVTLGPVAGQYRKVESDERGYYRMPGIAQGQYDIVARYTTGESGAERHTRRRAHIETNRMMPLDFQIPGGTSGIRGRIRVGGKPVVRSRISGVVTLLDGEREIFNLDIDGGEYALTDLPAGHLNFNISVQEYEDQYTNGLSPYAGSTNNLRRNESLNLVAGRVVERDFEFFPDVGVRGTAAGLLHDDRASVIVLEGYREFDNWNMDSFLTVAAQKLRSQQISDNTFIINDLPPRDYTVLAYVEPRNVTGDPNHVLANLRMQLFYVELAPGQMQELHFELGY